MKQTIISLRIIAEEKDESTVNVEYNIQAHMDMPIDLLIDSITDALNWLHEYNRNHPEVTFKDIENAKPTNS